MALPTIAPAATPPRMPRPTAGPPQPRRHCALASVGAARSAAAATAAAADVVRIFIMECGTSLGRPAVRRNAVKLINHPRRGYHNRPAQFVGNLEPHCEKMNKPAALAHSDSAVYEGLAGAAVPHKL